MVHLKSCISWRLAVASLCVVFALLLCHCSSNNGRSTEIHLLLNRHPFTESILRFIPEYEQKTGVKVSTLLLSEEEYFEKLITELSSRSSYYDLFMLGFPRCVDSTRPLSRGHDPDTPGSAISQSPAPVDPLSLEHMHFFSKETGKRQNVYDPLVISVN